MVLESQLYFEAHVTIEPISGPGLVDVQRIAKKHGFRVAELLMRRRPEDTAERSRDDTFMTARSKSYEDIHSSMVGVIGELKSAGFKVWRYKIEDTVLDSRADNDALGLL